MTVHQLGSGAVMASGAGAKAANLDRAAADGLPVPAGFVVPDAADLGDLGPAGLGPALRPLSAAVAVRSAFSAEDGVATAMAGRFETELGVAANEEDVAAAVARVRESGSVEPSARRDVLVMSMVAAERAGVLFTEQQFEDDLVNVVSGLAESLVSGAEAGEEFQLPKLRWREQPDPSQPGWKQRLALLMRDVSQTFGEGDWDIEWADDGTTCWLVQLRPITASPRRNETFTIANHKEILPELPSVLMASVVESSAHDLMSFYRDVDPNLPVDRPFIESFAGRPYINLSQLTDLLRRLGLPTALLADSLGGEPELLIGAQPLRLFRSLPTLVRLGIAQLGAVGRAEQAERDIEALANSGLEDFEATLEALRRVYVELVTQMSSLATAMSVPVALLRRLGVLDAHLSTQRTPGTQMLDDLEPLTTLANRDDSVRAELEAGHLPDDPSFERLWHRWCEAHGHRGVFESDVARPRFSEEPAPILSSILNGGLGAGSGSASNKARSSTLAMVTKPLWSVARRPMAAREQIRWSAMRSFATIRGRLLALADQAVAAGQMPDRAAVWDLSIDELVLMSEGHTWTAEKWAARRQQIEARSTLRLPDLLRRFDDLTQLGGAAVDDGTRVFRGVSLTAGVVEGVALRCAEPPASLPDGFDPATTILVARSVDAGWVPAFGQVAGVAVEIGGDLSHGSIILRELGLPAVTNLGEIGPAVATGVEVRLDAGSGRLELTGPEADD